MNIFWSGFMFRSKSHRVGVDAKCSDIEVLLSLPSHPSKCPHKYKSIIRVISQMPRSVRMKHLNFYYAHLNQRKYYFPYLEYCLSRIY